MDFEQAKQAFELYLNGYDRKDEKVYLKIVHTYGVVDCSEEIARRMGLGEEDIFLAKIIALLHDIGRFEQLKLYDSFEPGIFDMHSMVQIFCFGRGESENFFRRQRGMRQSRRQSVITVHFSFQRFRIQELYCMPN